MPQPLHRTAPAAHTHSLDRQTLATIEALPIPFILRDPRGHWLACSEATRKWFGYHKIPGVGRPTESLVSGDAWQAFLRADRIANLLNRPEHFEIVLAPRGEPPKYCLCCTAPVLSSDKQVRYLVTTFDPVSMRDPLVQLYRDRELMWELASKVANLGFFVWNREHQVCLYCSRQLALMQGLSVVDYYRTSGTTERIIHRISPEYREKYLSQPLWDMEEGMSFDISTPTNEIRHFRERSILVKHDIWREHLEIGVIEDVTEDRAKEIDLQSAKAEAERTLADLKRTQEQLLRTEKLAALGRLVAGMAHELNTPVGIMRTAATQVGSLTPRLARLQDGIPASAEVAALTEQYQELSGIIERCSRQASELIDRFKQLSAGAAVHPRDPLLLKPCLEEIMLGLRHRVREAGHSLRLTCPDDIRIRSHPAVLFQIVRNLVDNSLLHAFPESGNGGHITIAVHRRATGTVEIVYRDNGRGIPSKDIDRLFEPFFTTARGRGCSGLGLHIVYTLVVAQLGAEIRVENLNPHGCQFTLSLSEDV